jgi:N,N'-diacetyllegionaminate synthase
MDRVVETIHIGGHAIGPGHPCFIIGEAGVNHNGNLELAFRLIDAAVDAGVDAVKFQTFSTERVMTRSAPKAGYQLETTGELENQFDMVKKLELPPEAFGKLNSYCIERNILFLSSPFDELSADLLDDLDVAAFKIPSGEITNLPFLNHIAAKLRPMIVSTGMADISEVAAAVKTIQSSGNPEFTLLQCTSNYPAEPGNINLRAMRTMQAAFDVPVGYSDHTTGTQVPLAAIALGAQVIEKHFTLDRGLPGPDHRASLEPDELAALVRDIRIVESALGSGKKEPSGSEANTALVARKSLIAARPIAAGSTLSEDMIVIKRPGTGIKPSMLQEVMGRSVRVDIEEDSVITLDMLG